MSVVEWKDGDVWLFIRTMVRHGRNTKILTNVKAMLYKTIKALSG